MHEMLPFRHVSMCKPAAHTAWGKAQDARCMGMHESVPPSWVGPALPAIDPKTAMQINTPQTQIAASNGAKTEDRTETAC